MDLQIGLSGFTIKKRQRLRIDDPIVVANPEAFAVMTPLGNS